MAVDYKKLKVGDKVRYLGGDSSVQHYGWLTVGKEYDIIGIDNRDIAYIANDKGYGRFIGYYNAHCFELVDDEQSETRCNRACKHDSHIASLAKEVVKLKRELSEYKEYIEKEAVLFDERLIEIEAKRNIVGESRITIDGNLVAKSVYYGGDSE